jgi:hypothetical protein
MQKSLPQSFSEDSLRKVAFAKAVLSSAFSRIVQPDDDNMPTTFLAHTFFNADPRVNPIQEDKTTEGTSSDKSEIMVVWFTHQQSEAQTDKNSVVGQFWTNAVDGCGQPTQPRPATPQTARPTS